MKIQVTINVPEGEFCHGCEKCVSGKEACTLYCEVFGKRIHSSAKLPQCRAAEVKDDDAGMLEYDTDTGIYRVTGKGNSLDNLRVVLKEDE